LDFLVFFFEADLTFWVQGFPYDAIILFVFDALFYEQFSKQL